MDQPTGLDPDRIAGTNFIMLHLDLVDDLGGDFMAALLLDRIRFRAGSGWWTATRDDLRHDTRLSEHQLKHALNKLRDMGYVETRRVSPYDPTLMYRVIFVETTVMEDSAVTSERIPPPVMEDSAVTVMEDFTITTVTKNSEEQKQEPPYRPPNGFDEFWKAYPRKKDKGHARKAWDKAAKTTDPAVIVAAAVQYRQWCQQDNQDPNYIPHASTWLNGERWTDERDPTPTTNMQAHLALVEQLWENDPQGYPQLEG